MTFASFVKGIPREIDEAALIDGCNTMQMLFQSINSNYETSSNN